MTKPRMLYPEAEGVLHLVIKRLRERCDPGRGLGNLVRKSANVFLTPAPA